MKKDRLLLKEIRSLLIVKPSSLGDILHAFPLVDALRAASPGMAIDWVANGEFVSLVRRHPGIRHVWEFPRREFGRSGFLGKMRSLSKHMSETPHDLVIDAQGLLRSALLARLAVLKGRSGVVAGFDSAREGATIFYDRTVHIPETPGHPFHAVPRNLLFLDLFESVKETEPIPAHLAFTPEDEALVDRLLGESGFGPGERFVAIHPGARRASKRWPPVYFSELVRKMRENHLPGTILVGDRGEKDLLEEIEARSGVPIPHLAGKIPLDILPLFLSRAALFIGNDSGPLHMAALSGVPTLSFFGSSDPGRTGPWGGTERNIVLQEPLPCAPCGDFKKSCSHMTCQISLTPSLALARP